MRGDTGGRGNKIERAEAGGLNPQGKTLGDHVQKSWYP